MAFGYTLNAMQRLARWGMLLGAQPKEDVEDTHTLTYTCRVGVPWESTAVLQDQLLAGCWRGHAASSVQGGRSINADCRGVQHAKYTLYTWWEQDLPLVYLHTPCYFLFCNKTPCTVQIIRVTTHTCNNMQLCDDLSKLYLCESIEKKI